MEITQINIPDIPAWKPIVKSVPTIVPIEASGNGGFITKYWLWILVATFAIIGFIWWFNSTEEEPIEVKLPEEKANEPASNYGKLTPAFSVVTR